MRNDPRAFVRLHAVITDFHALQVPHQLGRDVPFRGIENLAGVEPAPLADHELVRRVNELAQRHGLPEYEPIHGDGVSASDVLGTYTTRLLEDAGLWGVSGACIRWAGSVALCPKSVITLDCQDLLIRACHAEEIADDTHGIAGLLTLGRALREIQDVRHVALEYRHAAAPSGHHLHMSNYGGSGSGLGELLRASGFIHSHSFVVSFDDLRECE